ncbi:MAG: phosphatase PAP2 family protein [Thermodesulfobacteriota bacterium]
MAEPITSRLGAGLRTIPPRTRGLCIAVGLFVFGVAGTLILDLTGADRAWTRHFYEEGGLNGGWIHGREQPWAALYDYGNVPTILLALGAFTACAILRFRKSSDLVVRACLVVVLTVVLGPGLIVNGVLKPYWGRPRPADLAMYGGSSEFRRVWPPDPGGNGRSFTCGHCAMAFAFSSGAAFTPLSPVVGVGALVGGVVYGVVMSVARIAQGGHFPSDALWSGVIVLALIAVLNYLVFRVPEQRPPPPTVLFPTKGSMGNEPDRPAGTG